MSGAWSWYSHLSDAFKRRVGRYLINRYLGPFLEEGILLDQLSVSSGCPITLKDVALNTDNINKMLEESEVPVEFVDGFIKELSVSVPWSNLLKDNCQFVIDGLTITLQVKKRENPHQISASIFHSMCESFSSINVAEDCLASSKTSGFESPRSRPSSPKMSSSPILSPKDQMGSMPGVALLAEAIDSIVMRVQVQLTNTTIRLEYVPTSVPRGMAVELKVANINYSGEIQGENARQQPPNFSETSDPNTMTSSTIKKILIEGVQLFSDEFTFEDNEGISPACSRVESTSRFNRSSSETNLENSDDSDNDDTNTCGSRTPPIGSLSSSKESLKNVTSLKTLQLASLTGRNELVIKFSETDHFGLPRSVEEVELNFGGVCLHVYPHQIHTLKEIIGAITVSNSKNDLNTSFNAAMSIHPGITNQDLMTQSRFGLGSRIRLKDPNKDTEMSLKLEKLLQAEMMSMKPYGLGMVDGWSGSGQGQLRPSDHQFPRTCDESFSSTRSSDFHEMPKLNQLGMDKSNLPFSSNPTTVSAPTPRIVIKFVSIVGILVERDESVRRLNIDKHESDFLLGDKSELKYKTIAMERMVKVASNFFQIHASGRQQPGPTLWNNRVSFESKNKLGQGSVGNLDRLSSLHARLDYSASWSGSHIQFVGTPLSIIYEEKAALNLSSSIYGGVGMSDPFASDYLTKTTVTIGQLSIKEILDLSKNHVPLPDSLLDNIQTTTNKDVVHILKFKGENGTRNHQARFSSVPDLKLVYKESLVENSDSNQISNQPMHTQGNINISLNPCIFEFDPAIVDRTYMLANYAELDPDCIFTPSYEDLEEGNLQISEEIDSITDLAVKITSQDVYLKFKVPKADMRMPNMNGFSYEEFVSSFWSKSVHPETFYLTLHDMALEIQQDGPSERSKINPLMVSLGSSYADIKFQENIESEMFNIFIARKSNLADKEFPVHDKRSAKFKSAFWVGITICMDESRRLKGKFIAKKPQHRMFSTGEGSTGETFNSYFENVRASNNGDLPNNTGNITDHLRLLEEQEEVKQALEFGICNNNLSIDLHFDDVSLLLPNKHVYEVIYNRLGNDMLLWLPSIFAIKEHLYNQAVDDPLQDPDMGFSRCFSGTRPDQALANETQYDALEYDLNDDEELPPPSFSAKMNPYSHFPKSGKSGLSLHVDTNVSLAVRKAHLAVCSSAFHSNPSTTSCDKPCDDTTTNSSDDNKDNDHCLFVANIESLELKCVVGLEKDPEICLLSVGVRDGSIAFGPFLKSDVASFDNFHYNGSQGKTNNVKLATLLERTMFNSMAWQECLEGQDLIQLTTKILFDSKKNFKTISLCTLLSEASLVSDLSSSLPPSVWGEWLAEFFTVVEYPVTGYVPPAILTEMRFDLKHCTVDIACDATPNNGAVLSPLNDVHLTRHHIIVALGAVRVLCSLLDTGKDASIAIHSEDLAFYVGIPGEVEEYLNSKRRMTRWESARPSWVCVCDLDLLEVTVCLKDGIMRNTNANLYSDNREENLVIEDILDVSISCNLLRIRTCVDTVAIIAEIGKDIAHVFSDKGNGQSRNSSSCPTSKENSAEPDVNNLVLPQVSEEVIPDLADAMAELDEELSEKNKSRVANDKFSKRKHKKKKQKGAQVFFFPNEGGNKKSNELNKKTAQNLANLAVEKDFAQDLLPQNIGMTDSFYNPSTSMRLCSKNPEELEDNDDDNLIQVQNVTNHFGDPSSDDLSSSDEDDLGRRRMDESFYIVDKAIGSGVLPKNKPMETTIRYVGDDNDTDNSGQAGVITMHDNHFAIPQKSIDYLKAPRGFPSYKSRITLRQLSVLWQIYGGRDFTSDKNDPVVFNINASSAPDPSIRMSDIEKRNERKRSEGLSSSSDLKTAGGLERNTSQLVEIYLSKIRFQHELYPDDSRGPVNSNYTMLQPNWNKHGHKMSSRQIGLINSFEIRDRVRKSDINKLLHLYSSKLRPRQSNANMFNVKCVNIQPDYDYQPEETIIIVSLQPLKLNIDQDTLFFLVNFISGLSPTPTPQHHGIPTQSSKPLTYQSQRKMSSIVNNSAVAAAVGIHDYKPDTTKEPTKSTVHYSSVVDTIEIKPEEVAEEALEDNHGISENESKNKDSLQETKDPEVKQETRVVPIPIDGSKKKELYIRSFIFARDVPIRVDYAAKYVDFNASASIGAIGGLLAGLTSLNCSELTLKRVCYNNGIVGVDRLLTLLITEWLTDIRQSQIPNILGGVGPMYSVLQLCQGVKDLFLLPIEQYQKDGRIIRGIQKGAHSFTSSTAMSFLDFTNRVLGVIKFAAEMAFEVMSPEGCIIQGKLPYHASSDPSASLYVPTGGRVNSRLRRRLQGSRNTSNIVKRPSDMREGVFSALAVVQEVRLCTCPNCKLIIDILNSMIGFLNNNLILYHAT